MDKKKKRRTSAPSKQQKIHNDAMEEYAKWKAGRTQNGDYIRGIMVAHNQRGDFRDYVLIVGDQLIDYKRTQTLQLEGKSYGVDGIALIHKSKLRNVIGEEAASQYWHPIVGRLVDLPPRKN